MNSSAVWDPDETRTVTWDDLHDDLGYTPYEGMTLRGWPVMMLSRGRVAVEDGGLKIERGSGTFLARDKSEAARLQPEMDTLSNFGADILPGG